MIRLLSTNLGLEFMIISGIYILAIPPPGGGDFVQIEKQGRI